MAGLGGPAAEQFQGLVGQTTQMLAQDGELRVGSGTLHWAEGSLAIHTDFGPPEQEKETNQDFILAWVASDTSGVHKTCWAIAMADGVTSSHHAEVGAELACRSALARLVSSGDAPLDKARVAIDAAGEAIGALHDTVESDPDRYRPDGEFASTWKYALREGLLLQTTLTLAWLEEGVCHLAVVGDGGAAVRFGVGAKSTVKVLASANMETNRVHALGPRNRRVCEFDCWASTRVEGLSLLALYTDGVGRGIGVEAESLFDALAEGHSQSDVGNVAERLIKKWIESRSEDFEDNLSLAVVDWGQPD